MTQGGKENAAERCLSQTVLYGCYLYEVDACIFKVQPLLLILSRVQDTLSSMAKLQGPRSKLYFRLAKEKPLIKGT